MTEIGQEPPAMGLMKLLFGSLVTQMIAAAVELRLFDHIAAGTNEARALADAVETDADATYRVLRGLSCVGLLEERAPRSFSLTPLGAGLRSDVPGSLAGLARLAAQPFHYATLGQLMHSIRSGESAFEHVYGVGMFEWFRRHPSEASVFAGAMSSFSFMEATAIVAAYDFSSAQTITDVGGGNGVLLATALRANPAARGLLFEVPGVLENAGATFADASFESRVELVPGDFFEAVPPGADLYLLKHVLHDWSDDRAKAILRNVARAMVRGARLLVVEQVVPAEPIPHFSKILDVGVMLFTEGGRERTEAEHAALLESTGFHLERVRTTESPLSILEARLA